MNTYQDSFQVVSTQIQGSGTYLSDSGNAYSFLPHLGAPVAIKTTSGSFYSASSGSGAIAIANASLAIDAPASIRITIGATAPTQANNYVGPMVRVSSNGTAYAGLVGSPSGVLSFQFRTYTFLNGSTTGAISKTIAAGAGNTQPAAGDYIFTVAPAGPIVNLYWQRVSDGFYYNLAANAYQAAKAPALTYADGNWLLRSAEPYGPNNVGLFTQIGSADVNAWKVTVAQAGGNGIMLPGDVWITRPSDTWVELYPFSSEGGVSPVAYTIQRQQGAGSWADVLSNVTPGQKYYDHRLSASTAYNYRLKTVDANSTTVTGASVSVTTLAARSITPYALGAGTMGRMVNGVQFTDTTGTSRLMRAASWDWDEDYQQYLLVCTNGNPPNALLGFMSADLINWTPFGTLVDSTTYPNLNFTNLPSICRGADGNYYLCYVGHTDTLTGDILVAKASAPMGPYTHFAVVGKPDGSTPLSDGKVRMDADGTPYYWGEAGSGTASFFRPLLPDFTGWSTVPVVTLAAKREGNATSRINRALIIHFNPPGVSWGSNAQSFYLLTGPNTATFTGYEWSLAFSTNAAVSPNPQSFPTVAQGLPAPAGAGPIYYPTAGYTPPAGWSGSTTGIDPNFAYMTQCFAHGITRTGQYYAIATRYDAQGNPGAEATSVPVWLPIVINSAGMPTIPWTAIHTPQAANPVGLRRRFVGGGVRIGFGASPIGAVA